MGYYWNPLEKRWRPIDHDRKLSRADHARIEHRGELIEQLVVELERECDSMLRLYTELLVRALVSSDEILTRRYGERVAALTAPDSQVKESQCHAK